MGLSTAERNKRKRERKKREREERNKREEEAQKAAAAADSTPTNGNEDVEIEYVAEPILSEEVEGLRKFKELVPLTSSSDAQGNEKSAAVNVEDHEDEDDDEDRKAMSKRKLREMLRPSVAQLKRKVARPELGTVPVPRNWGRKRKYLQGKVRT